MKKPTNTQTTKQILVALLTSCFAAVCSATALADSAPSNLQLGTPEYGGTGCPAGSVASVLSPDNTALSVLYDSYRVEAGKNAGRQVDQKSCALAIPIRVPQGYSVAIVKVDYRGYTFVPRGARARLNLEYFFAGSRGPRISNIFNGPIDNDYLLTDELLARALVWSPCGATTNLRINSSLIANSNSKRDDVLATLDSTDVDTKVIYHLAWQRCR